MFSRWGGGSSGSGGTGGWMGPERSLGGLSRTFGLNHQSQGDGDNQQAPIKIERARLRRVAPYFTPYWRKWLIIFFCIAATAALGVLPPQCVRGILDRAIPQKDIRLLQLLVGAVVALNILTGLIGVLQNYLSAQVGQRIMLDLRNQLYQHLQKMSLHFYTTTRAGEITSRLNNDVAAVQGVATATLIAIVSNLFTVIATVTVLFAMNWSLALLSIMIVPVFYFPTRVVGVFRRRLSQRTQEKQAALLAFIQERLHIGGILLTKIFGQVNTDSEIFAQHNREVMELNVKQAMAGRWLFMCLSVISVTGPALIYWYGGYQAIQQQLSIGTIIAFVAYLTNLYRPLAQLANVYVDIQGALAVFERIFEYLDLKPEVEDKPQAVMLKSIKGHIRFENVSFTYSTSNQETQEADENHENHENQGDKLALKDITFEILPGERAALVGPSGAGKTTVTYLLPRFFDPTTGCITVDSYDLRQVTQESLRAHIGTVTQETFLFHTTIRENLLYAKPEATEEEIMAATKAANIHDFILTLPDGYHTVVGERAFRLSSGEKQRLAIARALLKNPTILILDEATSNLDATSEYLIQQALETLMRGRTSLIIAHRLSTILSADKILVLNQGRLVEMGRHEDLVLQGGLYATLYHQQFSKVIEKTLVNSMS